MQRVLVVDDEQRTLDGVAQRVRSSGFDVEIAGLARDGAEALELTRAQRPGIVLCDIRMPGMDGIAYALKAKEIDPDIAVIFMSGYSDREYLKTAIRIGAIDYLDKPVDEDQFAEALSRAIQRREEAGSHPAGPVFDQDSLRLLLTGNNEELLASIPGVTASCPSNYVVVAAMLYNREPSDDTEQQFNMFTLHMMSRFSEEHRLRYTALRIDNRSVLLVKDEDGRADAPLASRMEELARVMLAELPEARERISIGIGGSFHTLSDTSRSYRQACEALDLVFFRGIGHVIRHGDTRGGQYECGESQLQDIQALCQSNELPRVTEALDWIHAKLLENEHTPVPHIKSFMLKVCQVLAQNYEREFSENMLENPAALHGAVMAAFTAEQLAGIPQQLIGKYTNALFMKDKKIGAIYKAKKYIWQHLGEEVSVKGIASVVYLSPTYLCALFKEVAGITVNQYVQQARMDMAKSLLSHTDRTVNEIANTVGYQNTGYFSRVFHRHTGMTPFSFRKKHYDV